MYLHTVSDRDTSSIFEEPFDGRSLSKLNLCEDGEYLWLGLGDLPCTPHSTLALLQDAGDLPPNTACIELNALKGLFHMFSHSCISTNLCDQQDEHPFYR